LEEHIAQEDIAIGLEAMEVLAAAAAALGQGVLQEDIMEVQKSNLTEILRQVAVEGGRIILDQAKIILLVQEMIMEKL
jgi:DNA primase large subunit